MNRLILLTLAMMTVYMAVLGIGKTRVRVTEERAIRAQEGRP